MHSYEASKSSLPVALCWAPHLAGAIEDFVYTRECWHYPTRRAPAVEATFVASRLHRDGTGEKLDVEIYYSWSPPTINFHNLQNAIAENDEFVLRPAVIASRPFSAMTDTDVEYYIGPAKDWLHWDASHSCFRGRVPPALASCTGVERQDTYTMPLELTASVIKHFPGHIRYESIMRCAFPLTIRRRPDACASDDDTFASPPLTNPTSILMNDLFYKPNLSRVRTSCYSTKTRLSTPYFPPSSKSLNVMSSFPLIPLSTDYEVRMVHELGPPGPAFSECASNSHLLERELLRTKPRANPST